LLRGKFGARAADISMSWMWGKFRTRRKLEGRDAAGERLGYPTASFEPLFTALAEDLRAHGGTVRIDTPARQVRRDGTALVVEHGAPGSFRRGTEPAQFAPAGAESYDAVLATVPSDLFDALAGDLLPADYRQRLAATEYHAALCLLLEVDRPFSGFYWTNIADPALRFVGLVEHTNLVPPERYDGRRFLYVANYVEQDDPLLDLDAAALLEVYLPGLRQLNPAFDPGWVRQSWRFADRAGQPIVTVGYPSRMPPHRTGVPGLLLANTTQIYPEDRGTNYAVREGERAAEAVLAELAAR
jgi:protoporphyrinogen oxidase